MNKKPSSSEEGFSHASFVGEGTEIDREKAETLLFEAAVENGSREAMAYIAEHREEFQTPRLQALVKKLALRGKE